MNILSPVSLWLALLCSAAGAAELEALAPWFKAQAEIQTWTADLVQTRSLKSLKSPLVSTGRVWFAKPNRFRWELGTPPQTIAVRSTNELLVIYPRMKRVERFPMDGAGPWKDALSLLEAGFPQTEQELQERFLIQSRKQEGALLRLDLQPRSASARRLIPQISLGIKPGTWELRWTELLLPDGSKMRNDYSNARTNEPVPESMLWPELDPAWKITEPVAR